MQTCGSEVVFESASLNLQRKSRPTFQDKVVEGRLCLSDPRFVYGCGLGNTLTTDEISGFLLQSVCLKLDKKEIEP